MVRIFPERTPETRQTERRDAVFMLAFCVAVALMSAGLFALLSYLSPLEGSWLDIASTIAFLVGIIALYGVFQSLLELTIAVSIGIERAIAIVAVLVIAGGLLKYFDRG